MRAKLAARWWRFTSTWTHDPMFTDAELGFDPPARKRFDFARFLRHALSPGFRR
jgi:hypothetical protein